MGRAYEVRKASIQKTGAQKAKLYSNFSKEIYLAAKGGVPDPDCNVVLKRLIEKAKKNQVPSDIINRAIEKAKGTGNDDYKSVVYEGFGPNSATIMVECLTDNVNRTVSDVREAFNKSHNKLGVSNSVAYNYDNLSLIGFKYNNEEEIFELLLDNNIEIIDLEKENDLLVITCKPSDSSKVKDVLENKFITIDYEIDETGMYPKEKVSLNGEDKDSFELLLSKLDNIDDVTNVYHNVEL